jgi:hypothetical protein
MPFLANVLKVMIASPGDVDLERTIVTQALHEWNDVNSSTRQLVLLPVRWETHSTPEYGAHPQTVINRQLLVDADILVAIFGIRIGTATEEHVSGTVEEIKTHVASNRTAKIYFSDVPVPPSSVDRDQYALLQAFKKECQESSLYAAYNDLEQFSKDFKRHLEIELNHPKYRWLSSQIPAGQTENEQISGEALSLLRAAATSDDGSVTHQQSLDGDTIWAGNQRFTDGTRRSIAKWKAIVHGLVERGALERDSDGLYPVTEHGYNLVDQADAQAKASEPTNVALTISGASDEQVLLVRSNHILSLKQLDFLTPTDACIRSQALSEEGNNMTVSLEHTNTVQLFNAPRTGRDHYNLSGPAKLRLVFALNGRQYRTSLDVMLIPKIVNNTQFITLTGSATFEV